MDAGYKQKLTEGLMTFVRKVTLTCYGKQSAILNLRKYGGSSGKFELYYFEALLW
jgi:hypothetical protein